MKATGLIIAALFAALATAASAADQDVIAALRACKAQSDQTARLACFDRLAGQYDAAAPFTQATAPVANVPAPPSATAAPPSVAQAAPSFGGENLARDEVQTEEAMAATIAKASFNAIGHFIVVLDNGQVWRQLDSDTAKARFHGADSVKITKGFMDSYSLAVDGSWGTYKVKRIK